MPATLKINIDAGNSNIKLAIYGLENNNIEYKSFNIVAWTAGTKAIELVDLQNLLEQYKQKFELKIINIACSAPTFIKQQLVELSNKYASEVNVLQTEKQLGQLKNGYNDHTSLGVDRWLCMIAAFHKQNNCCAVFDIGTALTCDFIDPTGQHLGGWIVPGKYKLINSLKETGTIDAKITAVTNNETDEQSSADELQNYGTSTKDAINYGSELMLTSFITSQMAEFISKAQEQNWQRPVGFITGNNNLAKIIVNNNGSDFKLEPNLLFAGMDLAVS